MVSQHDGSMAARPDASNPVAHSAASDPRSSPADPRSYLLIARRRWRVITGVFLTVLALSALFTVIADEQYRANAQLYISTVSSEDAQALVQGSNFTQRQVATYAEIVTSPLVLEPVIEELKLDVTPRELQRQITAHSPTGTVLINIAVDDHDPAQALAVAEAVSGQFVSTLIQLDQVSADIPSPVKATIVSPAAVSQAPVSPQPVRNLALGTVLGLLLGFGAGALRDILDSSVQRESDVKMVTDRTVIGGLAFDKAAASRPLIVQDDSRSSRAEAFRTLRTNLQFVDVSNPPRVIVFTSSLPNEGKSTTTANLALTMAATGSRVCVVEGDLRRPRLLEYMGLEGAAGLTTVLIGAADVDDVLQEFGDAHSLSVLGCGPIPPNPSELLGSEAMAALLGELRGRFDYVIIDAPPLLPVTDAAVLSRHADGTIVVVGAGVIKREHLARALRALENVGAHVLGLVMNRLPARRRGPHSYYYGYGYESSASASADGEEKSHRRR